MDDDNKNDGEISTDLESTRRESEPEHTEEEIKKLKYPKSVFFIVCNEFCERFNYYGMRTILSLYLVDILFFSETDAKIIYHTFTVLVYTFPVFGAMIADSYWGKFKTILYISMLYAVGSLVLAIAAVPPVNLPMKEFSILGLLIIAIGTGGIKPCVSAFGGDQFILPYQEKELGSFFSLFYFSINAGSLVSTTITPIIREDVHCFGDESCYSLAFAIPGILMIISIVIFALGRPLYKCKKPAGNMTLLVSKCIGYALGQKRKSSEKKEHWLDYASDKYDAKLIADIKGLMKVLFLYLPLPVFWALFDQQGTGWTFQARRMSGDIGFYTILPDQMQVVNPLLILAFIPIFQYGVYPLLDRCNILRSPLQRLGTGMALAAVAFVISAVISMEMEKDYPIKAEAGEGQLRIYNGLKCDVNLEGGITANIKSLDYYETLHLQASGNTTYNGTMSGDCINGGISSKYEFLIVEENATAYFLYTDKNQLIMSHISDDVEKANNGFPRIRSLINTDGVDLPIIYKDEDGEIKIDSKTSDMETLHNIKPGEHSIEIGDDFKAKEEFKLGGVYTVVGYMEGNDFKTNTIMVTKANRIHLLWLIPQYVVITAGEVMFSVTGLEFSYAQAPSSMKSVVQAGWLLTSAGGNLLVVIIESFEIFEEQSSTFFLYAAIMGVDVLIFALMAMRYKYAPLSQEDSEVTDDNDLSLTPVDTKEKNGNTNAGFKDDNDM